MGSSTKGVSPNFEIFVWKVRRIKISVCKKLQFHVCHSTVHRSWEENQPGFHPGKMVGQTLSHMTGSRGRLTILERKKGRASEKRHGRGAVPKSAEEKTH